MITGGTSGIGFAIAERFLQEGSERIIIVGRSYERLLNAAVRLDDYTSSVNSGLKPRIPKEEHPKQDPATGTPQPRQGTLVSTSDRISLLVGDVSDTRSWMRELEKAMQPVDILVNAAGISVSNILPKTEPVEISHILRTNLEGAMLTSRALLRASIRNRIRNRSANGESDPAKTSRCIINISSLLALKGGNWGVVRSNAIIPGYIETPMTADFGQGETSRLKDSIPLQRFGLPHEVADAAVFLARNEYANNCVVNLDGGLSAV
ncbi:SDR family NAD(P)-dependent oxidoreductase [Aspergillus tanneri]|uniref:Ketoreductase (KR) domain-containing protein n=1 Tax=Aspergillus tanneri TaxID=1220188 RepID=A0A5M9MUZ8_9EURO|nr:uncharacterized protein ATNIH1004_003621 [Aspergillus tanneri]KAA8650931.1 hypothetical protein ATNIH1004_003621 [Aspergillus tanneri]